MNWRWRFCRPLPYHLAMPPYWSGRRDSNSRPPPWQGDALPLSYFRINQLSTENHGALGRNRTADTRIFSPLLYRLSYQGIMATRKGLEPSTSAVTGRHSNQLNYRAIWWAMTGSNCRHPACKAGALPAELITHIK